MTDERICVMAVDDEPDVLTAYDRVLGAASRMRGQVDLCLCRQGEEAVERVRDSLQAGRPFAVIFLDVRMPPGMDGVRTAEMIRAVDAMVNIVIVTAYSDVPPDDMSLRVPPSDKFLYIQKPCHAPEIRQLALALGSKWMLERRLLTEQRHLEDEVRRRTAGLEAANEALLVEVKARCEAQDESARQQDHLIQAQKMAAIGGLVSGMAHEVSNPNNIILLNAATVARLWSRLIAEVNARDGLRPDADIGGLRYDEVCREGPELIAGIGRAADRIAALVRDLKRFARQDPAEPPVAVNPGDVVAAAVSLVEPLLRKSTRSFSVVKPAAIPAVMGNARQLEQVLVNLLSNACQALPDSSRAIRVEVVVDREPDTVCISVCDEGRGICVEHLPHVVEPFFTTRRDSGGTGLGLSVSDGIVRRHGGRMDIRSEAGKGTTVSVILPKAETRGRQRPAAT